MSRKPLRDAHLRRLPHHQRRPTPSIGTAEWPNQRVEPWTIQPKRCDNAARPAFRTFPSARPDHIIARGESCLARCPPWVDEVEVLDFVVAIELRAMSDSRLSGRYMNSAEPTKAETRHRKPLCRRRSAADSPPGPRRGSSARRDRGRSRRPRDLATSFVGRRGGSRVSLGHRRPRMRPAPTRRRRLDRQRRIGDFQLLP